MSVGLGQNDPLHMARSTLRKIDPAIDLSRHLLSFEQLPIPFSGNEVFGREAPLQVEVGSGKGLFLARAAEQAPANDYLGIELAAKYARYSALRLARGALANARIIQADASRVFRECLSDDCLSAVHVYFPDPWWKARHKKRRIMNAAFLKDVERTLRPGGALHFWTDVEEYFQTTLALIRDTVRLDGPEVVDERPADHELDYHTHFERRTRLKVAPVYRAVFRKPQ